MAGSLLDRGIQWGVLGSQSTAPPPPPVGRGAARPSMQTLVTSDARRSKFLSDKWMLQKGFLKEEDFTVTKPW